MVARGGDGDLWVVDVVLGTRHGPGVYIDYVGRGLVLCSVAIRKFA